MNQKTSFQDKIYKESHHNSFLGTDETSHWHPQFHPSQIIQQSKCNDRLEKSTHKKERNKLRRKLLLTNNDFYVHYLTENWNEGWWQKSEARRNTFIFCWLKPESNKKCFAWHFFCIEKGMTSGRTMCKEEGNYLEYDDGV